MLMRPYTYPPIPPRHFDNFQVSKASISSNHAVKVFKASKAPKYIKPPNPLSLLSLSLNQRRFPINIHTMNMKDIPHRQNSATLNHFY